MSGAQRIAVLGGSFDPITLAHVSVLEQAAAALGAHEAWILPTRAQPLRQPALADPGSRLELARVAVEGRERLHVVDDEVSRSSVSYTIDTLDALERSHPATEFWWILGADAARTIARWHRARDLLARALFLLVNRSGTPELRVPEATRLGFHQDRTRLLSVDSPAVSSSAVRERLLRGESVTDLVGAAVEQRILRLGLYKATARRVP